MRNHRSSSILLLHTLYIYLCMYIQRKRLFLAILGGFYRLSCACGEHRVKQPSTLFSIISLLASLCNRTSLLASCAIDSYLWPWHPAPTHGTTGSGSTAPSPLLRSSKAQSGPWCRSRGQSSPSHSSPEAPDWHYKGLGVTGGVHQSPGSHLKCSEKLWWSRQRHFPVFCRDCCCL